MSLENSSSESNLKYLEGKNREEINLFFSDGIEKLISAENISYQAQKIYEDFILQGIDPFNVGITKENIIKIATTAVESMASLMFEAWVNQHPKIKGKARVAILGGSEVDIDSPTWTSVDKITRLLANYGIPVGSGGGPGVMGAPLITELFDIPGIAIKLAGLPLEQLERQIQTEIQILINTFGVRQSLLLHLSNVQIFAPGGFGTLYEFYESSTLVKTGKYDQEKLLILLDGIDKDEYWDFIHKQNIKAAQEVLVKFNPKLSKSKLLKSFPGLVEKHLGFLDKIKLGYSISTEQIVHLSRVTNIAESIIYSALLETIYIRIKFGEEYKILQAMDERGLLPIKKKKENIVRKYRNNKS
jgi:predicted Rossmann-fold nucleotide-binding protein